MAEKRYVFVTIFTKKTVVKQYKTIGRPKGARHKYTSYSLYGSNKP